VEYGLLRRANVLPETAYAPKAVLLWHREQNMPASKRYGKEMHAVLTQQDVPDI
jgi:hypothetical protein